MAGDLVIFEALRWHDVNYYQSLATFSNYGKWIHTASMKGLLVCQLKLKLFTILLLATLIVYLCSPVFASKVALIYPKTLEPRQSLAPDRGHPAFAADDFTNNSMLSHIQDPSKDAYNAIDTRDSNKVFIEALS
jgi:hypothetical protein